MKQLLLITILTVSLFTACTKNNILKVNSFEVKAESEKAPSKVLIITGIEGDGSIEYTVFHEGAYSSLEGTEADAVESTVISIDRNGSKEAIIDTLTVYYRTPGTYEVMLEVKDEETFSESLTLTSNLKILQAHKWKMISSVANENGNIIDTYTEEIEDDYYEFKENMEYVWDFGENRIETEPYMIGNYSLSVDEDTLYMNNSTEPIFLKTLTLEKMEWELTWTEIDGTLTVVNGVFEPY